MTLDDVKADEVSLDEERRHRRLLDQTDEGFAALRELYNQLRDALRAQQALQAEQHERMNRLEAAQRQNERIWAARETARGG